MNPVTFMETPDSWPHLVLPLIRGREVAVLYPASDNGGIFKVAVGVNLFALGRPPTYVLEYDHAQAVVEAGWRID